jgi:lipoprotein-releasing system ATP-binding protein
VDSGISNQLLREFNARYGTAFVVVTHDDRRAGQCDRIVHLVDGRIDETALRP